MRSVTATAITGSPERRSAGRVWLEDLLAPLPEFEGPPGGEYVQLAECWLCLRRGVPCYSLGDEVLLVTRAGTTRAPYGTVACRRCLTGGAGIAVVVPAVDGLRRGIAVAWPWPWGSSAACA